MNNTSNCDLSNLSRGFFHEMDRACNYRHTDDGFQSIVPAMLFTQLARLSVSLVVLLLLATLYNMISVMDRLLLSSATCSLYWMLMVVAMIVKSVLLMVLVPVQWNEYTKKDPNKEGLQTPGFIVMAFLQSLATLLLFLALDHERQFRSADYATVDRPSKHCMALSCSRKLLLSWPRLVGVVLTCLPIGLLIAIEIVFAIRKPPHLEKNLKYLLWAYIVTLPLTRLAAVVMGVVVMVRRSGKLAPTVMARVYLTIGLVLSLMEDFPNFVTSCNRSSSTIQDCALKALTVFDVLQLLGVLSLLFYLLFIRSQYLRVEQESKLNLVWDLQKLLQVDGRKDIVRHKQYT